MAAAVDTVVDKALDISAEIGAGTTLGREMVAGETVVAWGAIVN